MVTAALAVISTSNSSPGVLSGTPIPLTGFFGQKSSHPGQLLSLTNNTSKLLTPTDESDRGLKERLWNTGWGQELGRNEAAWHTRLYQAGAIEQNFHLHKRTSFNYPAQPFVCSKRPHKRLITNVIHKQSCSPTTKLRIIPELLH